MFRAIQGVGGAVFPLSFAIIRDEFPPERQGAAMGLVSAVLGVGGGVGIVASGLIVDNLSWRWLFVVAAASSPWRWCWCGASCRSPRCGPPRAWTSGAR